MFTATPLLMCKQTLSKPYHNSGGGAQAGLVAPILFNIQDSLLHIEAIGMDVSPRLINIEPTLVRLQARARTLPQHLPHLRVRGAACHWMHLTQHAHWLFPIRYCTRFLLSPFLVPTYARTCDLEGNMPCGAWWRPRAGAAGMLKSTPIQSTKRVLA